MTLPFYPDLLPYTLLTACSLTAPQGRSKLTFDRKGGNMFAFFITAGFATGIFWGLRQRRHKIDRTWSDGITSGQSQPHPVSHG